MPNRAPKQMQPLSRFERGFPTHAGIDSTTGRGVDLVFTPEGLSTTYAMVCLGTFIDTVVNHNQLVCPLPSRIVDGNLEERFLPASFIEADKHGLLQLKKDVSADEVRLPPKVLATEYQNFSSWSKQHTVELAEWLNYYKDPHNAELRSAVLPTYLAHDFWFTRRKDNLGQELGIRDSELEFAFDFFLRGIKYHKILGETIPYFPHPVRRFAFGLLPAQAQREQEWSWGQYFIKLLKADQEKRDLKWLMDTLSSIHDLTMKYDATWYTSIQRTTAQQVELLSTIASESDLPAKLKESTHKTLKMLLAIGGAASSLTVPLVGVILESGFCCG
jgi:hypothetical protein